MLHQAIHRKVDQVNKLTLTLRNLGCTLPPLPKMYPPDQVVPIQPSKSNLPPTLSTQVFPTKQFRHISPKFLAKHPKLTQQKTNQPMFQAVVQNLSRHLIPQKLYYLSPVHCRSAPQQRILKLRHLNRLSRTTFQLVHNVKDNQM